MSDTLEIVEITDSSINIEVSPLVSPELTTALQNATKTKRRLSDSELDVRSPKKICADDDDKVAAELIVYESVINETIANDVGKTEEDCANEFNQPDILEKSPVVEKAEEIIVEPVVDEEEDILVELPSQSFEIEDEAEEGEEEEEECDDEEEELGDESHDFDDVSEEDDDSMMARAMRNSGKVAPPLAKPFHVENDEPIALDDSDDDELDHNLSHKAEKYESDNESEFSLDNNVIADSGESGEEGEAEESPPRKITKLGMSRKIVARSLKLLRRKREAKKKTTQLKEASEPEVKITEPCETVAEEKSMPHPKEEPDPIVTPKEPVQEVNEAPMKTADVEPMEVTEEPTVKLPLPASAPPLLEEKRPEPQQNNNHDTQVNEKKIPTLELGKPDDLANDELIDKPSAENSNESSRHESSLLTEITNSTKDEIFNRYVLKSNDQSPTLEEFSEELFYCLQMNNQELEKAKQLWNEKLHVKFKIRELMDTIRRHRAVMEIETFGFKPDNPANNSHPVVSSKSSTTTNSETDPYDKHFRMSSESVSRLINDVRASMLKRDDKLRIDDTPGGSNAGESSLASQWNNLNSSSAQGRQGQIIDVQSIINDFRQKNPQEIPRRGRRMKSSFGGGNYYDNQQSQMEDSRNFMSNVGNNSQEFTSSTMKSGQSGYPEVSLHPVQNLYKNLANATPSGSGFGGQKSSLLQSILTKQSTKSPASFLPNQALPPTSTLARLLTAPERSFQGTPKHDTPPPQQRRSSTKVHNNGEITITPISHNSRSKDYSMEDDDNSMEPPLVIDETEDFESGERSGAKTSVTELLCQGCKKNKAFFMCAGCSRQWYCSKECQEIAWDEHAESCMI